MSSISSEAIQEFMLIAGDNVSYDEAEKYLKMGKGNMEAALNYFFNKKDKAPKPSEPEKPRNIFEQLTEGSKNQAKVEKIIKELRKDYTKPIQPASNPPSTQTSAKKIPDLKVTPYPNVSIEKKSSSESIGSASKLKSEKSVEPKKPIVNDPIQTPNKESSIKPIGSSSKMSVERPVSISQVSSAAKSTLEQRSVQNLSEKFEKIPGSIPKIEEEDDFDDLDLDVETCIAYHLS